MRTVRISYITSVLLLLASLTLVSCVREELKGRETVVEGELVEVVLDVNAGPLVEMSEATTKGAAINTTTNKEDNTIKNLWVLQFNGTGDDASLIYLKYLSSYSNGVKVPLQASAATNRILFIANTFDQYIGFGKGSTLAEVKAKYKEVNAEGDVVYVDSTSVSGQKSHYPMMNGHTDVVVSSGATISGTLYHNVARVDVCIYNSLASGMTIQKVTVKSVPKIVNYVTDYILPNPYPSIAFQTTDYTPTDWTGGQYGYFTFYVPANKRGIVDHGQNDKGKQFSAPPQSSYVYVTAEDASGITYYYSFYLGNNLQDDYNVNPNGHYSYNFTISGKGNALTDGRVNADIIDYTSEPLANCYIINPPTSDSKSFRVPISRVKDYWGERYENAPDTLALLTENGWVVEVIWSDFEISGKNFDLTSFFKSEDVDLDSDYFEFDVLAGTYGNCVVGIRPQDETKEGIANNYQWSWHLWLTDYRPDMSSIYSIEDPNAAAYSYSVPGGNVHRYVSQTTPSIQPSAFASPGVVIMDRNLGALDANYQDSFSGYLYYQFGRKDPFPGNRTIYLGGTTEYNWDAAGENYNILNIETERELHNIAYSVNNPLTFIKGHDDSPDYWTYGESYNPYDANYIWQDRYATQPAGKSIFDPCPSGWKVPARYSTWDTFQLSGYPYFPLDDNDPHRGRKYIPIDGKTTYNIYYPFVGYIDGSSGSSTERGESAKVWSCMSNSNSGEGGYANEENVYAENISRTNGCFVRCIKVVE